MRSADFYKKYRIERQETETDYCSYKFKLDDWHKNTSIMSHVLDYDRGHRYPGETPITMTHSLPCYAGICVARGHSKLTGT